MAKPCFPFSQMRGRRKRASSPQLIAIPDLAPRTHGQQFLQLAVDRSTRPREHASRWVLGPSPRMTPRRCPLASHAKGHRRLLSRHPGEGGTHASFSECSTIEPTRRRRWHMLSSAHRAAALWRLAWVPASAAMTLVACGRLGTNRYPRPNAPPPYSPRLVQRDASAERLTRGRIGARLRQARAVRASCREECSLIGRGSGPRLCRPSNGLHGSPSRSGATLQRGRSRRGPPNLESPAVDAQGGTNELADDVTAPSALQSTGAGAARLP